MALKHSSSSTKSVLAVVLVLAMITVTWARSVRREVDRSSAKSSNNQEMVNPEGFNPKECVDAIKGVHGCFDAIKGMFHGRVGGLRRSCCRTLDGLTDGCWPSMFPGQLELRLMVKLMCLFKEMSLELPQLFQEDLE